MIGYPGESTRHAKRRRQLPWGGREVVVAAPIGVPTNASTKAQIVAWLLAHGVSFTEAALLTLTKDELLDLVADLLDNP